MSGDNSVTVERILSVSLPKRDDLVGVGKQEIQRIISRLNTIKQPFPWFSKLSDFSIGVAITAYFTLFQLKDQISIVTKVQYKGFLYGGILISLLCIVFDYFFSKNRNETVTNICQELEVYCV